MAVSGAAPAMRSPRPETRSNRLPIGRGIQETLRSWHTPTATDRCSSLTEVGPPRSPRQHWARPGVAEWLAAQLGGTNPTLVGIDHAFSFPIRYFQAHELLGLADLPRRLSAPLAD